MMLPRDTLHHEARVDENALLPGQVRSHFIRLYHYDGLSQLDVVSRQPNTSRRWTSG